MLPYLACLIVSASPMSTHGAWEAQTVAIKRQFAVLKAEKKADLEAVLKAILTCDRMYP